MIWCPPIFWWTLHASERCASKGAPKFALTLRRDETEPLRRSLATPGVCGGGGSGKGSSRPQNLPVAPWEADSGILQATNNISQWKNARSGMPASLWDDLGQHVRNDNLKEREASKRSDAAVPSY